VINVLFHKVSDHLVEKNTRDVKLE